MNKIIVITGAGSGVGASLKEKYINQGDIVISLDKSGTTDNNTNFACDVSNEEQVKSAFQEIGEKYKTIDTLINCAGFAIFGAVELTETERTKKMFDVNYFGTLYCCQQAIPFMKSGSKIINFSSACALFALPFRTHYCASKAAVSQFSFGLRMELEPTGIIVGCLCPGDIKTNFSKNRDKSFATNERYGDRVQKSAEGIDKHESGRMPLSYASKKIFAYCNKKNPKPMQIIGKKYKLLYFCQKFIPLKTLLHFTNKWF